jgi:hypothetical protein
MARELEEGYGGVEVVGSGASMLASLLPPGA